jgi:hypothetical protein
MLGLLEVTGTMRRGGRLTTMAERRALVNL